MDDWMKSTSPSKHELDTVCVSACSAVAAVHGARVAHRDIKPQQFCFTKGKLLRLKLLDFDSACFFDELTSLDGKCSPAFAATEVLLDPSLLAGPEVDVFALGLILVQLRRGFRQVFASDSAARDMAQREREIALALGQLQSDELRDLLRAMLHADPKQRLTMGQVMKNQLIAAGHVTLAQNANMAKEINSLGKKVDEAISLMKALSGSLSSFRQEALEGIASVRTNTAEGARAMADLKEELCAGEERLEAVSRASAQELRRALLDETWALARSLKSLLGAQAERAVEQTLVLARVERLQAEIQAQVATLKDDQREDLMSARQELVGLLRAVEGKVDEGFDTIHRDVEALQAGVGEGFSALKEGMEKRDKDALAYAAQLKREIDALHAMVTRAPTLFHVPL